MAASSQSRCTNLFTLRYLRDPSKFDSSLTEPPFDPLHPIFPLRDVNLYKLSSCFQHLLQAMDIADFPRAKRHCLFHLQRCLIQFVQDYRGCSAQLSQWTFVKASSLKQFICTILQHWTKDPECTTREFLTEWRLFAACCVAELRIEAWCRSNVAWSALFYHPYFVEQRASSMRRHLKRCWVYPSALGHVEAVHYNQGSKKSDIRTAGKPDLFFYGGSRRPPPKTAKDVEFNVRVRSKKRTKMKQSMILDYFIHRK